MTFKKINSPISILPNWINWAKNYAHHHVKGSKEEILAVYKVAIATKDKKTRLGSKPIYKYGLLPFLSAREWAELNKFGNLNPNRHSGVKWVWQAYTTSTVHNICTFAVLFSVFRPSFVFRESSFNMTRGEEGGGWGWDEDIETLSLKI